MVSLSGPITASMTEGLNGAGNVTANGTVTNTEPGTISWIAGGYSVLSAPGFGTLTIVHDTANDEGGYTWSFVFDSDDPALDTLDAGQSLDITFTVRVWDTSWDEATTGSGAPTNSTVNGTQVVDDHQVTITIFGENEVCLTRGTEILTEAGARRVEDLRIGDVVVTRDNGLKPVKWIASSKVSPERRRGNSSLEPIAIAPDAFGSGVPGQTLRVSPQHRILLVGERVEMIVAESAILASAKSLVNGSTVYECGDDVENLEYWHLAFDDHEIIFANGCPVESFFLGDVAQELLNPNQKKEFDILFPNIAGGESGLAHPEAKSFEGRVLSELLN